MRTAVLLLFLLLGFPQALQAGESDASSLEWQKSGYETKLSEKLRSAISGTIPEKYFVVSVNIQLKARRKKQSLHDSLSARPSNATAAELIPLGKLNIEAPMPDETGEPLGLFESIAKLSVTVLLDSSVPDSKQEVINRIIQNLTDPVIGEGQADISFDKVDLVTPHPAESWGFLRWMLELKTLLATLLATLVLAVFGSLWVREYRKLELKKLALLEQKYGQPYDRAMPVADATAAPSVALPIALSGSAPMPGFQKFRTIVREDREKAITLLKQWLKAGTAQSHAALSALPHLMDTQELAGLLPYLKLEEKRAWKRIVDKGIPGEALLTEADHFMSVQVLSALLSCHPDFDEALVRTVSELGPEDCLEIANSDATLGAVIAMILPGSQLASFYGRLRPEVVNEIIETIMTMADDRAKEYSQRLRVAIGQVTAKQSSVAFADRVDDLLRNAKPEHEGAIFDLLGRSGNFALLAETAQQFFPSELVLELPAALLKISISRFSMEKQVEILFSLGDKRKVLLDAAGAAGSKVRDVIDLELGRLEQDVARSRRVAKQSAELWKSFVGAVRDLLKNDEEAREVSGEVLKPWLAARTGGSDEMSAA